MPSTDRRKFLPGTGVLAGYAATARAASADPMRPVTVGIIGTGGMTFSWQQQPMSSTEIERPEDHATRIASAERHVGWLASQGPARAQRREQQQVGLIFREQHSPRRQAANFPANSAFFSPALDLATRRTATASRRIPADSALAESCRPRLPGQCSETAPRGATARSTSSRSTPVPRAITALSASAKLRALPSRVAGVLTAVDLPMMPAPQPSRTAPSNYRCSAAIRRAFLPPPEQARPRLLPKSPPPADTPVRHRCDGAFAPGPRAAARSSAKHPCTSSLSGVSNPSGRIATDTQFVKKLLRTRLAGTWMLDRCRVRR